MKRIFTTLLLGLLTLVLLVLAGLGILLATFDPNDYKDRIAALVQRQTGLTLIFDGELKTKIFPVLGISTGKLRVLDAAIYGEGPFLEVGQATLSLSVMPLLRGRVEVQDVFVDAAKINLVTTSTGRNNWEDLLGGPTGNAAGSSSGVALEAPHNSGSGSRQPGRDMSFTAESIRFTDLQVNYTHLGTKSEKHLNITKLELNNLGAERKMPFAFKGSFYDSTATLDVALLVDGTAIARGIATFDVQELLRAQLEMHIRQVSLDVQHDRREPLSLSAAFNLMVEPANFSWAITDLQGKLQNDSFTGDLAVGIKDGQMALKGKFNAAQLNLDALIASMPDPTPQVTLSPNSAAAPATVPAGAVTKQNKTGNPLSVLANAKGSFEWNIGRVQAKGLSVNNIVGTISIDHGNIQQDVSLELFGGKTDAIFTGNANSKVLQGSLDIQAVNLHMEQILQSFTGQQKMSGLITAACNVKLQGNDWKAIAPSLTGTGSFQLQNGEVRQIRLLADPIPGVAPLADTFVVQSLSATANINAGVAHSRDVRLQSPAVQATGTMTFSIPRNILDASLTLLVAGQPPAVPLIIRGPLDNLTYGVDMEALARGAVEQMLRSPEDLQKTIKKLPRETDRIRKDLGRVLDRL